MISTDSKNKINWRLISFHFSATLFIILAVKQFAFLNDLGILKSVDKYGHDLELKHLSAEGIVPNRLVFFSEKFW